jgi:hypothetical protein
MRCRCAMRSERNFIEIIDRMTHLSKVDKTTPYLPLKFKNGDLFYPNLILYLHLTFNDNVIFSILKYRRNKFIINFSSLNSLHRYRNYELKHH